MDKKAEIGEGIRMIYKLFLFSAVAFVVFGISAFSYNYNINVRNAEAVIMARDVFNCLAQRGVLNLDDIPKEDYGRILSYCDVGNSKRFYVGVNVLDLSGMTVAELYQGDSGALWVRQLFSSAVSAGKNILGNDKIDVQKMEKFNPGYFKFTYPVFIIKDGKKISGDIKVEVLVEYEK